MWIYYTFTFQQKNENEDDYDIDDEDNDVCESLSADVLKASKKKNKKKKKKTIKKKTGAIAIPTKLPLSRLLNGFTDYYVKYGQTDPPTR